MSDPTAGMPELQPDALLGPILRDYMAVAERLQSTHEALQHEVERLRAELESKDRELERRRRLAALGELAAGVAHEVRNPLGAIQLYSGLLRSECGDLQAAGALIDKIEAGIRAIDGVVQDTLALAPRRRTYEPVPVRRVIERASDLCRDKLDRAAVGLVTDLPDTEILVPVEPDGLQRVLLNLMINAADASPAGGVIEMQVRQDERQATITVADRGCGLPAELIDRIFDPFFTTKDHGTGLGLTIASRLVEAYGGELTANNREGGGAAFVIRLPLPTSDSTRKHANTDSRQTYAA